MKFKIRRVKQGDAETLAVIQATSWKTAFKSIISAEDLEKFTDIDRVTAMYSHLIDENIGNGYIGEVDGKAHCIAFWDKSRDEDTPQYAELICIHSLPDNWRKGFGSQMIDKILSDIKETDFPAIILWVFTENTRARKFYEAKGFTPTDKTKLSFGAEEVCYIKEIL